MKLAPIRSGTLDVPSLDGLRGLAVLWIILGHCWGQLGGKVRLDHGPIVNVFVASYTGVDMLFIISGFVLFLPVVVNGTLGETRSYAIRRAARILPAFYVALLFGYVAARILDVDHAGPWTWVTHLLFIHTEAHLIDDVGFGTNGAMWTMAVEVLFYATLPLVAMWYRRRPILGLVLAVSIAELWHMATVHLPGLLRSVNVAWAGVEDGQVRMALAFPSYLGHFAIGMTSAWLFVRLRQTLPERLRLRGALVAQVATVIVTIAVLYSRGRGGFLHINGPLDHWVKTLDRVILFALLVLTTALAPKIARWPFENRVVRTLGITCYGAYLAHLPVIMLLIPALGLEKLTTSNTDLFILGSVAAAISISFGFVSYAFFEEPFRRWARRATPRSVDEPVLEPAIALGAAPVAS
jgi:peptidoglycan/LPS O-acetylase OafA/YrhL